GSFVTELIVGLAVLPHSPDDALPFEGQFPDGFVVGDITLSISFITRLGPGAETNGAIGKLVPALAQELWARPTHVHPPGFTALFGDGSNAGIATDGLGTIEAGAIGSQGG